MLNIKMIRQHILVYLVLLAFGFFYFNNHVYAESQSRQLESSSVDERVDPDRFIGMQQAITEIDHLISEINTTINLRLQKYGAQTPSETTLVHYFNQKGVGWAQRYIKPWAGWEYVDWQRAKEVFYQPHSHLLSDSKHAVWKRKGMTQRDLDYLKRGMVRWHNVEREIEKSMDKKMSISADKALVLDQIKVLQDRKAVSGLEEDRRLDYQIGLLRQQEKAISNRYAFEKKKMDALKKQRLFSSLQASADERIPTVLYEQSDLQSQPNQCETGSSFENIEVEDFAATAEQAFLQEPDVCPNNAEAPVGSLQGGVQ